MVTMAQHYFVYIPANEFTHVRDQLELVEIKFENNLLPYIELHIKSLMTSNKFVFLNAGMICMVCTTLSVVHYCIYVCMFHLYATHLWAGTGFGLVYIPQIVYSIYVVIYSHLCKKMYYTIWNKTSTTSMSGNVIIMCLYPYFHGPGSQ